MRIAHWFRRDLRLTDNPALNWAAGQAEALYLVYIHAPEEEAPWSPGAASCWWLAQSLQALAAELSARGQSLILRTGPSEQTLLELTEELALDAVSWNRLYEPAVIDRDKGIKTALRERGLQVHSANAHLLIEPWTISTGKDTPYKVFTPFWKQALTQLPGTEIGTPPSLPSPKGKVASKTLDQLQIAPRHRWTKKLARYWQPGESGALARLDDFRQAAARDYATLRERPDQAGTSRLSPHLHWGEVGPRQLLAEFPRAEIDNRFLTELGWREFAHHLLYHFPESTEAPLNARYSDFPWRDPDAAKSVLRRWQRGETGIELVDAGMRELWETGWMHNRVRMIVASLLTKNLGVHWLAGARWFWDTLVDADLANNTLGWQWVAGCGADAAPYFRIFNPDTQAEKFDPDGEYRRRWLPQDRPEPIVDLKQSRADALQVYARHRETQ